MDSKGHGLTGHGLKATILLWLCTLNATYKPKGTITMKSPWPLFALTMLLTGCAATK
jgi:hypothetical protein